MTLRTLATATLAVAMISCNKTDQPAPGTAASAPSAASAAPAPSTRTGASDAVPTSAGELKITPLRHATPLR